MLLSIAVLGHCDVSEARPEFDPRILLQQNIEQGLGFHANSMLFIANTWLLPEAWVHTRD